MSFFHSCWWSGIVMTRPYLNMKLDCRMAHLLEAPEEHLDTASKAKAKWGMPLSMTPTASTDLQRNLASYQSSGSVLCRQGQPRPGGLFGLPEQGGG